MLPSANSTDIVTTLTYDNLGPLMKRSAPAASRSSPMTTEGAS
jgi:hypothetical protein